MIETERLILRRWREEDVAAYAVIRAQPEIARWLTPIEHIDEVISRINRYDGGFDEHGVGRWAVERRADGALIGACGILPAWPTLPVSPALDLGWHLSRDAWGHGYASEAARAALADGFVRRPEAREIIAVTNEHNVRSQAVALRIGMRREPARDFDSPEVSDPAEQRQFVFAAPRTN